MQTLSASLQAALIDIDARVTPRILVDLFELYEGSYVPGSSGFDPDDAIESFAAETITWNGNAYRREMISRGDIVRNMGEKTNSVTLTFSNISRYMATLAQSQQIEGLFLVIRCVVPSVTDDSLVLFVGRCEKPSDIDKQTFTLAARQDFGNINQEIPPRQFDATDPQGRTPSDPLYEGFRIQALAGSFQYGGTAGRSGLLGAILGGLVGFFLGRKKKVAPTTVQWSSLDATPYGGVVPMVLGRCQMSGIPIFFADIGYSLIGVWVLGEGRVDSFSNLVVRDPQFILATTELHYGDPGGTGTNATNVSGPINQGYLSKTAYVVLSMRGSAADVVDDPPLITAMVRGTRVPVPDSSGVFGSSAWSDNPVDIARFILTDSRMVGIDAGFMEDAVNYQTNLHCAEALIDDSNGEVSLLPAGDVPQGGTGIRRFIATGILNTRYWLYYKFGDDSIIPEEVDNDYTPFDLDDIPTTFAINRLLRKRYTINCPITDQTRAVDFLFKIIFPAAKLFLRINKRGKHEIRSEKSSDATMLRSATSVGDTSIPILDVTPWKTGPDLLIGRLLLGFGLVTSEVRNVSSAVYSTSGNSVTLVVVKTGSVTITRSGATLSGGSTTVQASGTVTIGGSPANGDTVTVTIDDIAIVYTLNADDTTGTVAAILSSYINATPQLRRYIQATWDSASPTIVTIRAKHGALNLDSQLLKAHSGPIADPTSTPSLSSSAGVLEAGTYKLAYADITALGQTALSPLGSITILVNKQIDVGAIMLVGTSRNWYMSDAANSEHLKLVANTNGSAFSINALPDSTAAIPRGYNTTGEELIRVAMSFATNSQDIYPAWSPSTRIVNGDIYLPTTPNGHKYQVATATGVAATGQFTGITEPNDGDTITVNGVVWTFKGAPSAPTHIELQGILALTMVEAASVLNASANPLVSAATYARVANNLTIVHNTLGSAGNAFTLAASAGGRVLAASPTLTGGSDLALDTTGTTEPTWPTTVGGTVSDNGMTWTEIGATYLGQAGLTRANVKKDSFKWPLGSRQSSVNQIKGKYRDANNDFALTPLIVNDRVHQLQVNKKYPLEVDLSAVDNFHQAFRIANWLLAKNREGDWFDSLGTGPQGMVLEEGDVICASDDSGGLVNVVTRIEELRIHANHDVTIAQARKYSTLMFADEVGADTIPVPTTLRYTQTVDSTVEFIDNFPIRDSDALIPAFYVAVSRDLATTGDWRGWVLYADYGDGYVEIARGDIPALMGVADTTLGTVTDPSVFDRVNTVDITLQFGPTSSFTAPFASVTEAELLSNARRNLFIVGDEYIQAATVTPLGGQSYRLSTLLRGRFGSDHTD